MYTNKQVKQAFEKMAEGKKRTRNMHLGLAGTSTGLGLLSASLAGKLKNAKKLRNIGLGVGALNVGLGAAHYFGHRHKKGIYK